MKYFSKVNVILALCILLAACGQSVTVSPLPTDTPVPSQTATPPIEATPTVDIYALPTFSFINTPAAGTNIPSPTPNPKIPTLIPTIDPNSLSDVLKKSISLQTLNGVNGHSMQRITGWNYGLRQGQCDSYQWLDSNHLLLYPRTGQGMIQGFDSLVRADLSLEPVVINLVTGNLWMRPLTSISIPNTDIFSAYRQDCGSVYWSQELGLIINQENYGGSPIPDPAKDAVITYTFDGQKIAQYSGKISGVSPNGEKILLNDKTIIDLHSDKVTDLNWHISNDPTISPSLYVHSDPALPINLYWSSDETRLYRCCYYFADLKTGKSYNFNWSDLRGTDGKPVSSPALPHFYGEWVRNDDFFLVEWNYFSDLGADYIPMFSAAEMKYYDLVTIGGMPKTFAYISNATYVVSPDGNYVWVKGFGYDGKYYDFLVNLITFKTFSYDKPINSIEWSPDSKFGWMIISDINTNSDNVYIFSTVENTLTVFPVDLNTASSWRPSDHILAYITKQNQTLDILDAKDMSVKEWKLPSTFDNLIWSPDGNHIALEATDGSLWQVDYPQMKNFEQLMQPMPTQNIQWSPDSKSIAFISGSDVYIVETNK